MNLIPKVNCEIRTPGTVHKSTVARYSFAISAAFVALFVRLSFAPILGDKVPYATFFLATTVSASLEDSDLGF